MRSRSLLLLLLTACSADPLSLETPDETAPIIAAGDCVPGAWCWMKGRPLSVAGDRTFETVHAFGPEGAFLRWSEDRWIPVALPEGRSATSAVMRSATDIWISDDRGIPWHFDGATWSESAASFDVRRVFAAPDGVVFARAAPSGHFASGDPRLLRRSGDAWVEAVPPYPFCMGGDYLVNAADDIWTAGLVCDANGTVDAVEVRAYVDGAWVLVGAPIEEQGWFPSFEQLDGRVRIHASGIFEWTGESWEAATLPQYPQAVHVDDTALSDGTGYTLVPRSFGCTGAFRLDDERGWCFGQGQIYVQTASGWRPTVRHSYLSTRPAEAWGTMPPAVWAGSDTLHAWGAGPEDVFRARPSSERHLERYDGVAWSTALEVPIDDMDGASATDVWFATERGVVHFDGDDYDLHEVPESLERGEVHHVRALGDGTVAAITNKALLYFDGDWTVLARIRATEGWGFTALAGSGRNDLWVVRERVGRPFAYELDHYDGATLSLEPLEIDRFVALVSADGGPWISSGAALSKIGATAPPIPIDIDLRWGRPWIGDGELWLTTDRQATRYILP